MVRMQGLATRAVNYLSRKLESKAERKKRLCIMAARKINGDRRMSRLVGDIRPQDLRLEPIRSFASVTLRNEIRSGRITDDFTLLKDVSFTRLEGRTVTLPGTYFLVKGHIFSLVEYFRLRGTGAETARGAGGALAGLRQRVLGPEDTIKPQTLEPVPSFDRSDQDLRVDYLRETTDAGIVSPNHGRSRPDGVDNVQGLMTYQDGRLMTSVERREAGRDLGMKYLQATQDVADHPLFMKRQLKEWLNVGSWYSQYFNPVRLVAGLVKRIGQAISSWRAKG